MAPVAAASGPKAFSSVQGPQGLSMVLFVNSKGLIRQWVQNQKNERLYGEAPESSNDHDLYGRKEYNAVDVRDKNGREIKTASGDLAVVTLISGDKQRYQVRAYYANEQGILSELCLDLDPVKFTPMEPCIHPEFEKTGVWFKGKLDEHKFEVASDTAISAHVVKTNGVDSAIKVYYFSKNPKTGEDFGPAGRPSIAWINLDYKKGWLQTESGI